VQILGPGGKPVIGRAELGNMAIVYKITNTVNNKPYIGWTSKTLSERFEQHIKDAKKHVGNRKFYNAIKKHGDGVWRAEILIENVSNDEAKQKEIEYIQKYNSYMNGYNSTLGGDGNNGLVMSEESNLKRSIALKGIPKNYDRMHGKNHSDETKSKISEAHLGMKKPWVKWNKQQIEKRAMTRRSLTKEKYDLIHLRKSEGVKYKDIASEIGETLDIVKKWAKKRMGIIIMKKSELKALIKEVIEEVYGLHEADNVIATIQTSNGPYEIYSEEDREQDNIKTNYFAKGPDGKSHWINVGLELSPYKDLTKQNIEDIKNWIESGMPKKK